jgi:hypothetical protein
MGGALFFSRSPDVIVSQADGPTICITEADKLNRARVAFINCS